jgi:hypothetical protein
VEQNRGPRYEATQLISNLSLTKELKIYDGERAASSTKTEGKTG